MEIWDILDSEGNKTGRTMVKGEEKVPEGFYHLGADVWIKNSENKILIQKRSPQKRLSPNVWAMTGGSVIKGETTIETIERETFEEIGVKLNIKDAKRLTRFRTGNVWVDTYFLKQRTGNVWVDTYFLKQDIDLSQIIMQKEEVSEVKWATYEEIEEIYQNGQFIKNRWEFVKDIIREF